MYRNLIAAAAFLSAVVSFIPHSLQAQKVWSLMECVDYAQKNNISIRRSSISSEIAEVNMNQSRFALMPTLNSSAGRNWNYGFNIDPYTNDITNKEVFSDNLSLNSGLTLFNGFQLRNSLQQSKLEYLASQSDVQKIRNDISLNVVSAYLQVLYAKEQLKVAEARRDQALKQKERIQRLYDAGIGVQGNLLDADAQLATEDLTVITAKNQLEMSRLGLVQLLQLNDVENIEVEDPQVQIPDAVIASKTPDEIFALAMNSLPEIKAAEIRLRSAEKGIAVAKGGYSPRLTAFGQLSTFYASSAKRITGFDTLAFVPNGSFTLSGEPIYQFLILPSTETSPYGSQFDQNLNKAFGFSLNIPLFNGTNVRSGIKRAKLNAENSQLAYEAARNQLLQSIRQAHADMRAAKTRYDASVGSVAAFEAAWQYAQKRYDAGLINALEYITTLNNLTRVRIDLLQAKYDYIFRLKVLDFYAGNAITF